MHTMGKTPVVLLAGMLLAPFLTGRLAGQNVVTFNLTNVNSATDPPANLGGEYTSPYTGNINGGPSISVICDDFAATSYIPESWSAYHSSLSSISSGTPDSYLKFSGTTLSDPTLTTTLDQATAYTVAAYLAVEIMQQNQAIPAQETAAEELSYALWDVFDPALFEQQNGSSCTLAGGDGCIGSDYSAAVNYLNTAVSAVVSEGITPSNFIAKEAANGVSVNSVDIYTYDSSMGPPTGCSGPCPPPPQEFIAVSMAEPTMPAILGFDLLGALGAILFTRRRMRART